MICPSCCFVAAVHQGCASARSKSVRRTAGWAKRQRAHHLSEIILEWWARCALPTLRIHYGSTDLTSRSSHAAARLKQFCNLGQHADRRFAGYGHFLRRTGLGRRWRRAVPYHVLGDGNTHHHGRVLKPDRAARLMSAAGSAAASCRRPMRSWPDASWTAPNVAETARAAKTALNICDMRCVPRPMAITNTTRTGPKGVRRYSIT